MHIVKVNPQKPEKKIITIAAELIRKGELVVFPTETVYGLGANALNKKSVQKIFQAKKRPLDNPLIIHIAELEDLKKVAKKIPPIAFRLAKKFWPGPLTLVLFKKKTVPSEATAGLKTVAVRMPSHPVAQALIDKAGTPIAAPSANKAGKPSATEAKHAYEDFKRSASLILDAGQSPLGLESTVIDCTTKPLTLLRPGFIPKEAIEKELDQAITAHDEKKHIRSAQSPGMKYRHYAPRAPLILVQGELKAIVQEINRKSAQYKKQSKKVGILATIENRNLYTANAFVVTLGSRKNLKNIAKCLFSGLRLMDKKHVDVILCEALPLYGIGCAIMNRLEKASSHTIRL